MRKWKRVKLLVTSGTDFSEINAVRKYLSVVKGGHGCDILNCRTCSVYQSGYIMPALFPISLCQISAYRLSYLFRQ
ncbi:MAG: DUF4147 domain-containing protein [Proteiniphilum sp.]|nr:DUF4147 domain-containing protein [Proteiniphilum sp.]